MDRALEGPGWFRGTQGQWPAGEVRPRGAHWRISPRRLGMHCMYHVHFCSGCERKRRPWNQGKATCRATGSTAVGPSSHTVSVGTSHCLPPSSTWGSALTCKAADRGLCAALHGLWPPLLLPCPRNCPGLGLEATPQPCPALHPLCPLTWVMAPRPSALRAGGHSSSHLGLPQVEGVLHRHSLLGGESHLDISHACTHAHTDEPNGGTGQLGG